MQLKQEKSSFFAAFCLALLSFAAAYATPEDSGQLEGSRQPSAEPYSFSYSSDSIGGQSTHEESGDGSGRVTGFYTIAGDDGRERRVDYVADENGYRAQISTNEIGTRNESSADAQFNVRQPSEKQLEAAKVTLEQYKYLEETHAGERELQLNKLQWNQNNRQQQQQQQQHQQPSSSSSSSSSSSQWSSAGSFQQRQQQQPQPARQQTSAGGAFSGFATGGGGTQASRASLQKSQRMATGGELDGGGGGGHSAVSIMNSQSESLQKQNVDDVMSGPGARLESAQATWMQDKNNNARQQQQVRDTTSALSGSSISITDEESNARQQQQQQQQKQQQQQHVQPLDGRLGQQVQVAAWQMGNQGGFSDRKSTNAFQRQMELQFVQQAQQLTDQDYPRQTQLIDRQQQQVSQQRQAAQVAQFSQQQKQGPSGQLAATLINNQRQQTFDTNELLPADQQLQQQQQQSNIIDEPPADQHLELWQTNEQQQQQQNNAQLLTTTTTTQLPIINPVQQPTLRPQSIVMQLTSTPAAPAGFIAIDLGKDEQTNSQIDQSNQEVDQHQRQPESLTVSQPNVQFGYDQFVNQSSSSTGQQQQEGYEVQTQFGQKQQTAVVQQQQQQQQQQTKGQQQQTRPSSTTSTPATAQFRPTTSLAPTKTTTQGRVVFVETTPVPIIETTTARQVQLITTTTTVQPIQEVFETNRPTAPIKATEMFTTVGNSLPLIKPQQQQQQQQVKGGGSGRRAQRPFVRPQVNYGTDARVNQLNAFAPIRTNAAPVRQTISTTTKPRPQQAIVSYQNEQLRQTSYHSTSQPELVAPGTEKTTSEELPRLSTVTYQRANEQQQFQQPIVTTTQQPQAIIRPLSLQVDVPQQKLTKGTKGGSSRTRQNFWQPTSASRSQQQQPNNRLSQTTSFAGYGSRNVVARN